MPDLDTLSARLSAVVIFRAVADSPVLTALRAFFNTAEHSRNEAARAEAYAAFLRELYPLGGDFGKTLADLVAEDENVYVHCRAHRKPVPAMIERCAKQELALFTELSRLSAEDLRKAAGCSFPLPEFENTPADFLSYYEDRLANLHKCGFGIFARYTMFRVEGTTIVPVRNSDPISVADLIGYEAERQQIIDNTRALIDGKPAANVLLCGDAGTGKSSSVKAVTNLLAPEGIRLIEVRKEQLLSLPAIMAQLSDNPLKFILFIDDLSFNRNDDSFGTLKALLEGSASVRAKNTVIYATSNRRHLIRETFSDRDGDEVHQGDTVQELMSLSERFGMTILFSKPTKALYLEIVRRLAELKQLPIPAEELDRRAEAFALRKGGRSARAAEQFTDLLLAEQE